MHQAARLQFERMMSEFGRWQQLPADERSAAPPWWWGSVMAVFDETAEMPACWCRELGLRESASFADGARKLASLFADQTIMPYWQDFPRKAVFADLPARDLQPQPSDDSAFQP
jgi:hypothetical protein